ncbi:S-layer homology domain-containing protein [Cohnella sp. WQ 127256]|uniref:S-layer homology domain-containing protein n=1 Tax=Cohnella sp. WQ 127256 TaxID=2938790 RepID=UPI0021192D42|nr:S-layer homology domain-containing protein [Cohnella sp. WQ 127256]
MKKSLSKKMTKLALALTLTAGAFGALTPHHVFAAETTDIKVTIESYKYTQDELDGLDYLNAVRTKVGLSKVKLDPYLIKAAQNHAKYLFTNTVSLFELHDEVPGNSGFTGVTPADRANFVGASGYDHVGEAIFMGNGTIITGVRSLIEVPYHRMTLISPNLTSIGLAKEGGSVVGSLGNEKGNSSVTVYPYDGQKNVPVAFPGGEVPNPLEQFGVERSGFIISYQQKDLGSNPSFSLKDSKGNDVPVFSESNQMYSPDALLLIPKENLKYSETYTATVNNKSWSFTTINDRVNNDLASVLSDEPIGKYSEDNIGLRFNRSYVDLMGHRMKMVNGTLFMPITGVFSGLFKAIGADVQLGNIGPYAYTETTSIATNFDLAKAWVRTDDPYREREVELSAPPFKDEDGLVYFPVRLFFETLGATVTYDDKSFVMSINFSKTKDSEPTKPEVNQFPTSPVKLDIPSNYLKITDQMKDLKGHWAAKEIAWAISKNITQGYPDNTFRPDQPVTEAEFLAFLFRALKSDTTGLDLQQHLHWADGLYNIGARYQLPIPGYYDLKARETKLTRTRVAEIITAVDGFVYQGDDAIQYLLSKGYSVGKTAPTVEGYHGNDKLTRAETVKFLLTIMTTGLTELK